MSNPSLRQLHILADFFGVSVDDLSSEEFQIVNTKQDQCMSSNQADTTAWTDEIIRKLGQLDSEKRAFIETLIDLVWANEIIRKLNELDPENRMFIETLIDHAYEAKKISPG